MLSKSKGQILRVAAALQVLFSLEDDTEQQQEQPPNVGIVLISEDAIKAAINFVEVCCQQVAYMAGRGKIVDELAIHMAGRVYVLLFLTLIRWEVPIPLLESTATGASRYYLVKQ